MWQYYLLTANLIDEQCRGVWANCINLVPLNLPLLCWHNLLTAAIETLYGTKLLPRFISISIKILLQTLKNLRCKCTRVWQVFTCLKESLSTVSYLFSINHTQGIYPIGVTGGDPNRRVCVVGMSRMHNLSEGRDGVVKTEKGRWESRSRTCTKTRRINRFNRTCKWWSRLAWISEHKNTESSVTENQTISRTTPGSDGDEDNWWGIGMRALTVSTDRQIWFTLFAFSSVFVFWLCQSFITLKVSPDRHVKWPKRWP